MPERARRTAAVTDQPPPQSVLDPEPDAGEPTAGAQSLSGAPVEREFTVAERTQAELIIRRFLRHRLAVASLVLLVLLVLLAFVGEHLWHFSYSKITPDNS